ncbi:DUF2059 domain-containing protein [Altererythrobacter sp. BO-6]|uniref:DUF2059 domain-containing protein n=1 Tax=Altererythrobacter sp. BO-6 TaxID=2604537 RepID=UPI0013E19574|nr:DUF2059 domain-containing protein [Altererythrobacter sp. BO-6]QIG54367.1 DUF2059 domain-containing protein [Altererythrobacter sp. BO-6]
MKMMKSALLALAPAALALPVPAAAQSDANALARMFQAEPLTAEQEARLPLATSVIEKMIPPGTLGETMGGMFERIMNPIMEAVASDPGSDVARQLGVGRGDLDVSDADLAVLATILDPAGEERRKREAALLPQIMQTMMEVLEPTMRKAMIQAYAVHFDEAELVDIDAFFSTPSGLAFARKSFTMSSDPRILGASLEAMPQMMASFGEIERKMKAATADLPAPRSYGDLSMAERKRIETITGFDQQQIAEAMAEAAFRRVLMSETGPDDTPLDE